MSPWALRLTFLQGYFTLRTATHSLVLLPRKTCCPGLFYLIFLLLLAPNQEYLLPLPKSLKQLYLLSQIKKGTRHHWHCPCPFTWEITRYLLPSLPLRWPYAEVSPRVHFTAVLLPESFKAEHKKPTSSPFGSPYGASPTAVSNISISCHPCQ